MGDDDTGEDCTPETDDNILFGDGAGGDLEVAILGTCESAQWSVWNSTGYFASTDAKLLSKIFYIGGCDPADGIELPS